jgi:hypothetical protein
VVVPKMSAWFAGGSPARVAYPPSGAVWLISGLTASSGGPSKRIGTALVSNAILGLCLGSHTIETWSARSSGSATKSQPPVRIRAGGSLRGRRWVTLRCAIAFRVIGIAPEKLERGLLRRQVVEVVIRTPVPPVAAALRHAVLLCGAFMRKCGNTPSRGCVRTRRFWESVLWQQSVAQYCVTLAEEFRPRADHDTRSPSSSVPARDGRHIHGARARGSR